MIELSLKEFYDQNYGDEGYCLYVMKNDLGDVLYIGISTADIWSRWFGGTGHIPWSGTMLYGNSTIGEKIVNHLPDSWTWKIQLWTLKDCQVFCEMETPDPKFKMTIGEYKDAVRNAELRMIRIVHLSQHHTSLRSSSLSKLKDPFLPSPAPPCPAQIKNE